MSWLIELISASFKMFWGGKWKWKSPTNSRDFYPDPPNNEKFKSSVFWMNKTILIIFVFLFQNNIFVGWILDPGWPQPASPDGLIHPLNPSLIQKYRIIVYNLGIVDYYGWSIIVYCEQWSWVISTIYLFESYVKHLL